MAEQTELPALKEKHRCISYDTPCSCKASCHVTMHTGYYHDGGYKMGGLVLRKEDPMGNISQTVMRMDATTIVGLMDHCRSMLKHMAEDTNPTLEA